MMLNQAQVAEMDPQYLSRLEAVARSFRSMLIWFGLQQLLAIGFQVTDGFISQTFGE